MWKYESLLIVFVWIIHIQCQNNSEVKAARENKLNVKKRRTAESYKDSTILRKVLDNILSSQNTTISIDNLTAAEVEYIVQQYDLGTSNEDIKLNIVQLISKYGFPVEKHQVKTEDDYMLSVFRIPKKGPIVFLMHGLMGSSDDWIVSGPDKGLAYMLSSEGYDVWLGNARGNKHSRKHRNLSPSSKEFWNFSWDEIGRFDLPAMIDYVLNTTDETKLKYVGHSQGTTSFFVMCSMKPEYNDKISLMVALSAVAWMSHLKSPSSRLLAPFANLLFIITQAQGLYELKLTSTMQNTMSSMCSYKVLAEIICSNVWFLLFGFNRKQFNATSSPVIFGHATSGASTMQFIHYGQEINSGHFRRFDFGIEENLKRYGSKFPPDYPVEKITAPVAIFFGDGDWLSERADVEILRSKLSNMVEFYDIPDTNFNHIDFLWANDIKVLVFSKLLQLFKKF